MYMSVGVYTICRLDFWNGSEGVVFMNDQIHNCFPRYFIYVTSVCAKSIIIIEKLYFFIKGPFLTVNVILSHLT